MDLINVLFLYNISIDAYIKNMAMRCNRDMITLTYEANYLDDIKRWTIHSLRSTPPMPYKEYVASIMQEEKSYI